MGISDHRKQRLGLRDSVNDKIGIEDLVSTMLGVRLSEHHELDVRRVASEPCKCREQVVYFIVRKRERQSLVGHRQRPAPAFESRYEPRALGRRRQTATQLPRSTAARSRSSDRAGRHPELRAPALSAPSRRYCMPRSMRRTKSRPQTPAISVALLDQGEMVPGRGTTNNAPAPSVSGALASTASRRESWFRCWAFGAVVQSTKCT